MPLDVHWRLSGWAASLEFKFSEGRAVEEREKRIRVRRARANQKVCGGIVPVAILRFRGKGCIEVLEGQAL